VEQQATVWNKNIKKIISILLHLFINLKLVKHYKTNYIKKFKIYSNNFKQKKLN
jgi:hypothetical protein